MSDDHSPLAPPLPIPNRTVKRRRADDSVDYPCESRSSSGTHKANAQPTSWAFCFARRCWHSDLKPSHLADPPFASVVDEIGEADRIPAIALTPHDRRFRIVFGLAHFEPHERICHFGERASVHGFEQAAKLALHLGRE